MIIDTHNHSVFSFDGHSSMEEMCHGAVNNGVTLMCTTDHCDFVAGQDGFAGYIAVEKARLAACAALPKPYGGKLRLLYGVELGNPQNYGEQARAFLQARRFDFVLGAVHFLPDGRDIYQIPFRDTNDVDAMFRGYFDAMEELVAFGHFDSLAHLEYPLRLLQGILEPLSLRRYAERVEPILARLAQEGKALEINTRGAYAASGRVEPEAWILETFRGLGGQYVTVGSDSHGPGTLGAGFDQAAALLTATGFEGVTVFEGRKPLIYPLNRPA